VGDTVVVYRPRSADSAPLKRKDRKIAGKIYRVGHVYYVNGLPYADLDTYDGHPAGAITSQLYGIPLENLLYVYIP
jgi:hypothetical protein